MGLPLKKLMKKHPKIKWVTCLAKFREFKDKRNPYLFRIFTMVKTTLLPLVMLMVPALRTLQRAILENLPPRIMCVMVKKRIWRLKTTAMSLKTIWNLQILQHSWTAPGLKPKTSCGPILMMQGDCRSLELHRRGRLCWLFLLCSRMVNLFYRSKLGIKLLMFKMWKLAVPPWLLQLLRRRVASALTSGAKTILTSWLR